MGCGASSSTPEASAAGVTPVQVPAGITAKPASEPARPAAEPTPALEVKPAKGEVSFGEDTVISIEARASLRSSGVEGHDTIDEEKAPTPAKPERVQTDPETDPGPQGLDKEQEQGDQGAGVQCTLGSFEEVEENSGDEAESVEMYKSDSAFSVLSSTIAMAGSDLGMSADDDGAPSSDEAAAPIAEDAAGASPVPYAMEPELAEPAAAAEPAAEPAVEPAPVTVEMDALAQSATAEPASEPAAAIAEPKHTYTSAFTTAEPVAELTEPASVVVVAEALAAPSNSEAYPPPPPSPPLGPPPPPPSLPSPSLWRGVPRPPPFLCAS
ncbi:hypothetical protein T492DRAFT_831457 [Pavlovales sp. CCMP2436]|nr:hypothetical protein T492DRAFT_831457 [Pavlovales sp. CCMP2436]